MRVALPSEDARADGEVDGGRKGDGEDEEEKASLAEATRADAFILLSLSRADDCTASMVLRDCVRRWLLRGRCGWPACMVLCLQPGWARRKSDKLLQYGSRCCRLGFACPTDEVVDVGFGL